MMDKYILDFPQQIYQALEIADNFKWQTSFKTNNIIITGMGGSGIGGTFVQEYYNALSDQEKLNNYPIIINKSYHLPSFADDNTLLIASSYSGNTEETLCCLNDAIQKKCNIVAISSGGKLAEECTKRQYPIISLPKGFPPRTCLAYSFIQILQVLTQVKTLKDNWKQEMKNASKLLVQESENIRNDAKNIAQQIYQTFPLIYTLDSEALALRLRQQLNENSKILCSHHIIPEMNHNEIVGWKNLYAKHSVISILTDFDLPQNRKRYNFCINLFKQYHAPIIELKAKGDTKLQQWMYIIHLSDWISYELALLNHEDPIEVKVIDELKVQLLK